MMASKLELRGNANRGLESSVTVPKNIEGYLRSICTQWRAIRQACQVSNRLLFPSFVPLTRPSRRASPSH